MAMALHATIRPKKLHGNNFFAVLCRLTASGSYTTGGDLLDLKVVSPTGPKQPIAVLIWGISGTIYQYDLANKKIKVLVEQTVGTNTLLAEHTAAALVAGVTGDTIFALVLFA